MENFVFVGLDLGWIIGLTLLGIFLLITGAAYLLHHKYGSAYHDGWLITGGVGVFASALTLVILIAVAVPFNAKYYGNYYVTGTVDEVTNTFTDASGQLSSNPVVDFSGISTPIEVSDPRFLRLVGEDVTLKCSVIWHFRAADTYSCSLASIN